VGRTATPHWRTVRHHFACWTADGTLARAHARLRGQLRAAAGRAVALTTAIIDRLAIDYESKPEHGQAWVRWAMVCLMVKRLARQAPPLPARSLRRAA
jgi:transposase